MFASLPDEDLSQRGCVVRPWFCRVCGDQCLRSEPGDTRAMYNETPTVRATVTLRKSKHGSCKNNSDVSVHFLKKKTQLKPSGLSTEPCRGERWRENSVALAKVIN